MNRRRFLRSYTLVLSASPIALLLVAVLLLVSNAQSAGRWAGTNDEHRRSGIFAQTTLMDVTKLVDKTTAAPGETLHYQILISVPVGKSSPGSSVSLSDAIPAGTTFVSGPNVRISPSGATTFTCSLISNTITCTGSIPEGNVATVEFLVRINDGVATGTLITNTVFVMDANSVPYVTSASTTVTAGEPTSIPDLEVHLPILNDFADEGSCDARIQVQNIGDDLTQAVVLFWSGPGSCGSGCKGPSQVECTGLLAPGSAWSFQAPAGSTNGVVFSLSNDPVGTGTFADAVCERVNTLVKNNCEEYLLFKQAFDESSIWQGFHFGAHVGEPLAVEVIRTCQTGAMNAPITGAYAGISGEMLGVSNPVFSGYAYYAPLLRADQTNPELNNWLYIQNAGLECTAVELWFHSQGDCLRAVIQEIPVLVPGESYRVDVNSLVDSEVVADNVWIRSMVPLAIVADTVGESVLTTQSAMPAELNFTFNPGQAIFTPGDTVLFGSLIYYRGWEVSVQVQSLSPVVNAKVKVYFFDDHGDLIATQTGWICPRGSRTFSLPPAGLFDHAGPGWVQVVSEEWQSEGDPPVLPPNIVGQVILRKLVSTKFSQYGDLTQPGVPGVGKVLEAVSYSLLPARRITGASRAFLPAGGYKDLRRSGLITEIGLTNFNRNPGTTRFRIDLYEDNQIQRTLYCTLSEGQTIYIDLIKEGQVRPGSQASLVIEAESTTQGDVVFGAVGVIRFIGRDIRGDESAAIVAWPVMDAPVLSDGR